MYECGTIWRRPFPVLCVALRAFTSVATVWEWDVSADAGSELCKVLICVIVVCRNNFLICVLMSETEKG